MMRDSNTRGSTATVGNVGPRASRDSSGTAFLCGDKGPDVLSFGKPPPSGTNCHWHPLSTPCCQRAIRLTEGLAIRFQVRQVDYVAWTSVGTEKHSHNIFWGISRACQDYLDPTAWIFPPESGPGPSRAVRKLFTVIKGSVSNFPQRERLGFNNVVMLAQLDRAFESGALPELWIPSASGLLENGKIPEGQVPQLRQTDADLQLGLAHLVPQVAMPEPQSGPDSSDPRYCLARGAAGAGLPSSSWQNPRRIALQQLDGNMCPLMPSSSTPARTYQPSPSYCHMQQPTPLPFTQPTPGLHAQTPSNATFPAFWDAHRCSTLASSRSTPTPFIPHTVHETPLNTAAGSHQWSMVTHLLNYNERTLDDSQARVQAMFPTPPAPQTSTRETPMSGRPADQRRGAGSCREPMPPDEPGHAEGASESPAPGQVPPQPGRATGFCELLQPGQVPPVPGRATRVSELLPPCQVPPVPGRATRVSELLPPCQVPPVPGRATGVSELLPPCQVPPVPGRATGVSELLPPCQVPPVPGRATGISELLPPCQVPPVPGRATGVSALLPPCQVPPVPGRATGISELLPPCQVPPVPGRATGVSEILPPCQVPPVPGRATGISELLPPCQVPPVPGRATGVSELLPPCQVPPVPGRATGVSELLPPCQVPPVPDRAGRLREFMPPVEDEDGGCAPSGPHRNASAAAEKAAGVDQRNIAAFRGSGDFLTVPSSPRFGDERAARSAPVSPAASEVDSDSEDEDVDDVGGMLAGVRTAPVSPAASEIDSDSEDEDVDDVGDMPAGVRTAPVSPAASEIDSDSGDKDEASDVPSAPESPASSDNEEEDEMMAMLMADSPRPSSGGRMDRDGNGGSPTGSEIQGAEFLVFKAHKYSFELTPGRTCKLRKRGVSEVVDFRKYEKAKKDLTNERRKNTRQKKEIHSLRDALSAGTKAYNSLHGRAEKGKKKSEVRRVQNYRHRKRLKDLIAENKAFKDEIKTLRKSQGQSGIAAMRKGNKPRSHLTLAAIAMTLEGIEQGNVAACRWQPLCNAIQQHVAKPGEKVDLRAPSDRQVRRLMEMDDYIQLAHEKEELEKQKAIGNLQFMCDISPMLKRELLAMGICYSSTRKLPELGGDGNPALVKRFTQLLLPILEMADKEGASVDARVKQIFEVMGVTHQEFYHVCSDGGVEITGNDREYGTGPKGMFDRSFAPAGCYWTWCMKHLLNVVYSKTELTDIYKNLDTLSRFLRVANRFNKLKPHMLLILRHWDSDQATRYEDQSVCILETVQGAQCPQAFYEYSPVVICFPRYHEEAWERIQALQEAIEALNKEENLENCTTEDLLNKVSTVLLGEKGRWLSSAAVAVQLGPLLPLLKQAILLCYAKRPGDPDSLTGCKQRMAQRVYAILDSPDMMYRMQAAAIMMRLIFQPMYDASGRQNHTLFGGEDGVQNVCEQVIATLGSMITKVPKAGRKGKDKPVPNEVYFGGVVACIRATAESDVENRVLEFNRYIVGHVTNLEKNFKSHFERVNRMQYMGSQICEEQWIACGGTSSFITVPTARAIQAAADVTADFDKVPAGRHEEWPEHMLGVAKPGCGPPGTRPGYVTAAAWPRHCRAQPSAFLCFPAVSSARHQWSMVKRT